MFKDKQYADLLDGLEHALFRHITETRAPDAAAAGRSREPVLFQIDHGTAHLQRVRDNMHLLLGAADAAPKRHLELEDSHRFIALAAALFHDLGMHFGWYALYPDIHEPPTPEQIERIRKHHGEISAAWFRLAATASPPPELNLPASQLDILRDPWLNERLAFAIEAHQWPLDRLDDELRQRFDNTGDRHMQRALAYLVKLADTLDMDQSRVGRAAMERMAQGLLGRPSDIHVHIDDISRKLMVHYLRSARCQAIPGAGFVLQISLEPRVPGAMLNDPAFRPFLDYLTQRYRARLDPHDNRVSRVLQEELGIVFAQVVVPQFQVDPARYSLPPGLLPELLASVRIREARLAPVLQLEDWVRSRWLPSPAGIQPAWEAFERDEVAMDEATAQALDAILRRGNLALLLGQGACGKSVFAVAYARRWARATGGKVFWLDLREQERLVMEHDLAFLDAFNQLQLPEKLLVVDNAHVDESFIRAFLDRTASLISGQYLLVARPRTVEIHAASADMPQRLAGASLALPVDASAFRRTADFLCRQGASQATWNDADYQNWAREFGGDLIAFGQAVRVTLASGGRPTRYHAIAYVRERYLDVAATSPGGKDAFLHLCALSGLDLPVPDRVIGGGFNAMFPRFAEDGLAVQADRGHFRYWQFIHAGLADLILHAAARDAGRSFEELQQAELLAAAELNPYSLGAITYRLSCGRYGGLESFDSWKRQVLGKPGLLEESCVVGPVGIASLSHRLGQRVDPDRVTTGELGERLLITLRNTQPHFVVTFLNYLGEPWAKPLLDRLLEDDDYYDVLRRSPPHFVVKFLSYLGKPMASPLLDRLLDGDAYFDVLRRSPPQLVVTFLSYVEEQGADPMLVRLQEGMDYSVASQGDHRSKSILSFLMTDAVFRTLVINTAANNAIPLFDYACHWLEQGQDLREVSALFQAWSVAFRERKATSNFEFSCLVPVFRLAGQLGEDVAEDLRCWIESNDSAFSTWVQRTNEGSRKALAQAIAGAGLTLREDLDELL